MPDTSRTGKPYKPAAVTKDDDFLAGMADTSRTGAAVTRDPWKPPPGVGIAGTNAQGMPIYAPASDLAGGPGGSAAGRFLSSAYNAVVNPVKGMYHGLVEGPQNPEEAQIEAQNPFAGRGDLLLHRFVTGPIKSEARRTAEEFAQSNPWSMHPTQEQIWHREKALGHGLATVIPLLGPAAAQTGEQVGTQIGTGDVAGGLGTLAGAGATYAAPELAGKVARSQWLTRSIPTGQITRMIRPAAADLRFGKDPAAVILREGITGNSLDQIGDKVYDRLHLVGVVMNRVARDPAYAGRTVDLSGALKPLDDAIVKAQKAGDKNLFNQLLDVKDEVTHNWKPFRTAKGEVILRPTGLRNLKMSPYDALQFKRMVGDRIRWTGEPLNGEVNQALGSVYGQVKDSLNAVLPNKFQDLNKTYSDLVGAAKAIERRLPIEARNAHWSLTDIALGASGHVPLALARHVLRWPGIRSRGAKLLYNLPRAVPKKPTAITAPVIGAAQSAQRLRDLQQEAERRKPALVER
jgi:hypothetical protein